MFATERRTYASQHRPAICRSMSNGMIAGVCAGLGEHFGISIRWLRIAVIVVTFMTFPAVPIIYGICVLAMPKGPGLGPEVMSRRRGRRGRRGYVPPIPHYTNEITPDHLNREFDDIEARIRTLEDYVTSREYVLKRKFESL